jgi:hypothetical protein
VDVEAAGGATACDGASSGLVALDSIVGAQYDYRYCRSQLLLTGEIDNR